MNYSAERHGDFEPAGWLGQGPRRGGAPGPGAMARRLPRLWCRFAPPQPPRRFADHAARTLGRIHPPKNVEHSLVSHGIMSRPKSRRRLRPNVWRSPRVVLRVQHSHRSRGPSTRETAPNAGAARSGARRGTELAGRPQCRHEGPDDQEAEYPGHLG